MIREIIDLDITHLEQEIPRVGKVEVKGDLQ